MKNNKYQKIKRITLSLFLILAALYFLTEDLKASPAAAKSEASFSIYPNPAVESTRITFEGQSGTPYKISVIDMLGKVVMSESGITVEGLTSKEFDVRNLKNGLYLIMLQEGNKQKTLRLLIEK